MAATAYSADGVLLVGDRRVVPLDVAGGPPGPGRVLLPAQDGPDDVLGGDRGAVVVRDRHQPVGQRAAQGRFQERRDLGVAVLLDDVDPLVPLDEADDLVGDRQGPDAAVARRDALLAELVAGLDHRPVGAAVGDQADLGARASSSITGAGSACRAVSSFRASRSRFFFQSSGRSL